MFETVPSVEYKLLDEEKSQFDPNDSLDDISVSLNDPRSKVNGHKQLPQENNTESPTKCAPPPPPLLYIDEETNLGSGNKTSYTNNINQDNAVNDDEGKQVNNVSCEVIKEDANDAHKSPEDSELIKSSSQNQKTNGDTNQNNLDKIESVENGAKRKDSVEDHSGKQTPMMSNRLSALSMASIASGESAGSISFSADSLGIHSSLHSPFKS